MKQVHKLDNQEMKSAEAIPASDTQRHRLYNPLMPSPAAHVELLAPAGDIEAMRAAVANGADAVYFGLANFNARHRAANFSLDELPQTIKFLHDHNVKAYVTFNTLIFSDELSDTVAIASSIAQAGADAIIVQDLGLARLIQRLCPDMPLHASTQMTLTEPRGIELARTLGIQRVILARELSIAEIRAIALATDIPLEVFVHGALCVAYSGQCLTSESIGGRSANRGQCAQACRLPYDLIVDGTPKDLGDRAYLLSPQDLAAHDRVADLLAAGVSGLKIEGRLKSAHYVAATTQTYRAALESARAGKPFAITPQQRTELEQSFSRGFARGFLDGPNHQALIPARFSKSRGTLVGTVIGKTPRGIIIDLHVRLKPGDGVVFDEGHPEQDEQGGRVFTVQPAGVGPQDYEVTFGHGDINLAAVASGSMVWKTDDPALRKRLEQSWSRDLLVCRTPLTLRVSATIGQPLQITLRDNAGHEASVTSDQPLQRAIKHPLTEALLREQFGRLGNTPFELANIEMVSPDPAMVPKSVLNDLRRQAVDQLLAQRSATSRIAIANPDALAGFRQEISTRHPICNPQSEIGTLLVLCRSLDQLRAVLDWRGPDPLARPAMVYCDFEDVRRYRDAITLARSVGIPIGLATIRIIKPQDQGLLQLIADAAPDAILVRNLAALAFFRENTPQLPLIGDYSLNIANELTADLLASQGLQRMVPGYDLNWQQLKAMFARISPSLFEVVIHQHMPMFHMEHCVFAATLSSGKDSHDCGRPCERHRVELRDRTGMAHPLLADVGCRNTVFNATAQGAAEYIPHMLEVGVRHFRVELLLEPAAEASAILTHYARLLAGLDEPATASRRLHVLNQLGVTAGTMEFE